MNLWVYKCRNDPGTSNAAFGDWPTMVFTKPWRRVSWGGAWATNTYDGQRIFDYDVTKGDLVLAWQSDKSAAIGICEVMGRTASREWGTDLVLKPVEEFVKPVKLHVLKRTTRPALADVRCLKQGYARTIYPTTTKEARLLLSACGSRFANGFGRPTQ